MRLAFVFLLTVFYNTQLESSWGRNGDGVPTVRQLAKEISNLEKEGDSLMENINEINDNIETLKTTASNIESMVGSSK